MNQETHYDDVAILSRIPHRFENVLLDSVRRIQTEDETYGEFTVEFREIDSRSIFFQSSDTPSKFVIRTALMEILALASIVCTDYPEDSIIIFASISNFVINKDVCSDTLITGKVVKLKDKGNFVRCKGTIGTVSQPEMASGELMAFIISKSQLAEAATAPKIVPLPPISVHLPVDKSRFSKQSCMVICDQIRQTYTEGTVTGEYTYPLDHPLIKGHFPDNPIMMGIMQLLSVEDVCTATFSNEPQHHNRRVCGQAQIIRHDGALIAEIKNFEVDILPGRAAFHSTKKVVFRESVRPGDTFFTHLFDLTFA